MSDSQQQEQDLLAFLADIDCLDALSQRIGDLNIFDVLKLKRVEIRHSNMLAWFLDPNENHGLGDSFLYGFLTKLPSILPSQSNNGMREISFIPLLSSDLSSFKIKREWFNIDLLIISYERKVVIAIENKIDSGLGDKQLDKYDDTLKKEFPGWQCARVLLAPDQSKFDKDSISWGRMEYDEVFTILNHSYNKHKAHLKKEADVLISNYLKLIEHSIMEDSELRTLCNDIYQKHKNALDLIFKYHEGETQPAKEICEKWVDENQELNKEEGKGTTSIKFRSNALLDYFGRDKSLLQYYYQEIRLWYDQNKDHVGVKMSLVFYKDEKIPNEVWKKMTAIIQKTKKKDKSFNRWRTVDSRIASYDVWDINSEKILAFLGTSLKALGSLIPE